MIVSAGASTRKRSLSTSDTNPIYANGIPDDGVSMTENPAYVTHMDGIAVKANHTYTSNPLYANGTPDDGITMMENPAYTTRVDIMMENHTSAANPIYANGTPDGIAVTENPAYTTHVYTQVYPTLPTRPRPTPSSQPSTYNTSDSTSDRDYI